MEDRGQEVGDRAKVLEDVVADRDVLVDLLLFLWGERLALAEDGIGDADLPDVMNQAREIDVAQLPLSQSQLPSQFDGDPAHSLAVAGGVGILGVNGGGQGPEQPGGELLDLELMARLRDWRPRSDPNGINSAASILRKGTG